MKFGNEIKPHLKPPEWIYFSATKAIVMWRKTYYIHFVQF